MQMSNALKNLSNQEMAQKQKIFLEVFENTMQIHLACQAVGIERSDYNYWLSNEKYKEFQAKVYAINESFLDLAEAKLISSIKNGHQENVRFFLRTKGKERGYVEESNPIANINLFSATPEDLKRMEQAAKPMIDLKAIGLDGDN
jgi:hypothetical protein